MTVRVNVYPSGMTESAREVREFCERVETLGLDGAIVGDHVCFFDGAGSDGLIEAASLLTAGDRLRVMVAVYLLPLRHPVPVARQLADLAALAPGRLSFGVGIGGEDPHEVESCGVDPRTRGRRMDESLSVLRPLLAGESTTFAGEFFTVEDVTIEPVPTEPIPLLVGGRSDAAVRRAGRYGDGWLGVWVSARRFGQVVEEMSEAASEAGRGAPAWDNALNVWCGVGDSHEEARGHLAPAMQEFYKTPYEAFEKWSPAGTAETVAEFLAPYREAGCHTFNLIANGSSPDAVLEAAAAIRTHLVAEA